MDFMDAQWECEGELILVSSETLNPRELLLYQHGQFLLQHLHLHKMVWICLSFSHLLLGVFLIDYVEE